MSLKPPRVCVSRSAPPAKDRGGWPPRTGAVQSSTGRGRRRRLPRSPRGLSGRWAEASVGGRGGHHGGWDSAGLRAHGLGRAAAAGALGRARGVRRSGWAVGFWGWARSGWGGCRDMLGRGGRGERPWGGGPGHRGPFWGVGGREGPGLLGGEGAALRGRDTGMPWGGGASQARFAPTVIGGVGGIPGSWDPRSDGPRRRWRSWAGPPPRPSRPRPFPWRWKAAISWPGPGPAPGRRGPTGCPCSSTSCASRR